MSLGEYRRKRNFSRTKEPSGITRQRRGKAARGSTGLRFVVQKHHASHRHYDFRLELEGTLKSWAVPKGPSLDPRDKRLAIEVEDHPLEYADFEGRIPEGEYGAGTIIVWDRGVWQPEGDPVESLRRGSCKFRLDGEKLHGRWFLVRMPPRGANDGRNWLLIKERDEEARAAEDFDVLEARPESVLSNRTIDEVASGNGPRHEPARRGRIKRAAAPSAHKSAVREKTARPAPPTAATARPREAVSFEGVRLTHPDRVMYADVGLTKIELAAYYAGIAELILPHIVKRPLSLLRCPSGHHKDCFYQKNLGPGAPEALGTIAIREKEKTNQYAVVRDLAGLLSLVQIGCLEIHPWGARADDVERPDRLTLDLDPGPGVSWSHVVLAAQRCRDALSEAGLQSFVKTTGGKGLHVTAPLVRRHDWGSLKRFARAVAEQLVKRHPGEYTMNPYKSARVGKIFVDYLRNERGATAIAPYSTRARPGAPLAVPLAWEELSRRSGGDEFTVGNLIGRLRQLRGDPWREFWKVRQSISSAALRKLPSRR